MSVLLLLLFGLQLFDLTGGLDFNTAPLTATFASGITMSNVNVPVIMDSIGGEKNEVLGLTLDMSPSLAPAITAGNRDRAVGVIVDITSKNLYVN